MQHRIAQQLSTIPTPAYVVDELRLARNLEILGDIKKHADIKILFAIKGCPLQPIFGTVAAALDGFTASGVYEARLAHEVAPDGEIHTFCPAYTQGEIAELLSLQAKTSIYFNSLEQLARFAPMVKGKTRIGLRVNPALSLAKFAKYDPCRASSHFGVSLADMDKVDWSLIDTLHVHALCENMAEESARLIAHCGEVLRDVLPRVKTVNFGGGHFITHPDYKTDILVEALREFKNAYPHISVVLEPGAAVVYDAGYIVSTVLSVQQNDNVTNAVIDTSANAHVPDVMKAGVRLSILGEVESGGHPTTLVARTCMARDVWGDYRFAQPLAVGDKVVFLDGLQYSLGEANWFNGHPRPDLGVINTHGDYRVWRHFDYADFKANYSR